MRVRRKLFYSTRLSYQATEMLTYVRAMFGETRLAKARPGTLSVNQFCSLSGGFSLLIDKSTQMANTLGLQFRRIIWDVWPWWILWPKVMRWFAFDKVGFFVLTFLGTWFPITWPRYRFVLPICATAAAAELISSKSVVYFGHHFCLFFQIRSLGRLWSVLTPCNLCLLFLLFNLLILVNLTYLKSYGIGGTEETQVGEQYRFQ